MVYYAADGINASHELETFETSARPQAFIARRQVGSRLRTTAARSLFRCALRAGAAEAAALDRDNATSGKIQKEIIARVGLR